MKNLLKSEICRSHEQCTMCTLFTEKVNNHGLEKKIKNKKKQTNADTDMGSAFCASQTHSKYMFSIFK